MTSHATARRPVEARFGPGVTAGGLAAAAALAASLTLALAPTFGGEAGIPHVGTGAFDGPGLLLLVLAAAPLVAWKRSPLGVLALTVAASTLLTALDYPLGLPVGPAVALYFLAVSRDQASPWSPSMTAAVLGLLGAYLLARVLAAGSLPEIELTHTGLAWAVAWFAGERARLRQEKLAALRERAARAERDAERERLLAVAEERSRIARDLHDSAGHAVNVIAVCAGAARLRHDQEPHRSADALQAIEDLARQTAEEIDHIVGALREPTSSGCNTRTSTGLASLGDVITQHTSSGLQVSLDTQGPSRPLDSPADQAAYRILQEALTNAARHGAGTARIELRFGDTNLDIDVTNPIAARNEIRHRGGHGLVGMRERATLLGGELTTERADGVFRVHASIPYVGPNR